MAVTSSVTPAAPMVRPPSSGYPRTAAWVPRATRLGLMASAGPRGASVRSTARIEVGVEQHRCGVVRAVPEQHLRVAAALSGDDVGIGGHQPRTDHKAGSLLFAAAGRAEDLDCREDGRIGERLRLGVARCRDRGGRGRGERREHLGEALVVQEGLQVVEDGGRGQDAVDGVEDVRPVHGGVERGEPAVGGEDHGRHDPDGGKDGHHGHADAQGGIDVAQVMPPDGDIAPGADDTGRRSPAQRR